MHRLQIMRGFWYVQLWQSLLIPNKGMIILANLLSMRSIYLSAFIVDSAKKHALWMQLLKQEYSNIILSEEKDSVMNKIDLLKIVDMYEKEELKDREKNKL